MVEYAFAVCSLIGVGSKAVALGLNQIGACRLCAEFVQVGHCVAEGRNGKAVHDAGGYGLAQAVLMLVDAGQEETIEYKAFRLWFGFKCMGDVI